MSEAEQDRREVVLPFAEVYIKEELCEAEVKVGRNRKGGMSTHKPHLTILLMIFRVLITD